MPDFTVHPHGNRWAVLEDGSESPIKEFGTRDAAELAARDLAQGGEVTVTDEDPLLEGCARTRGRASRSSRPSRISAVWREPSARARLQTGL